MDKEMARLEMRECTECFAPGRIAGQALTPYTCTMCKRENMHANTAIPKLCGPCSHISGLCCRCAKNPVEKR